MANVSKKVSEPSTYMVTVSCLTYNHAPFIEETMDGFCMQQTCFPFVCCIIDDDSTDGEQDIIRNYMAEHFDLNDSSIARKEETNDYYLIFARHKENINCHFAVVLLKYNHHHKKDKAPYVAEWRRLAKYNATCDGDDFWNHPLKLQKQFDLMEAHPEYSLCFHANYNMKATGEMTVHKPKEVKPCYTPEDAIRVGGGFMATCSMFYRWEYLRKEGRPTFLTECPIGDLPLMLFHASKGNLGYIDEVMSVYRMQAAGSWSTRQNTLKKRTRHHRAIAKMYDEFDRYSGFRFHEAIAEKKRRNERWYRKDAVKSIGRCILERLNMRPRQS